MAPKGGRLTLDMPPEPPYYSTTIMTKPRSSSLSIHLLGAVAVMLLAALTACSRTPVERAISGKFTPEKNNKIITGYCTSCHTHKDFKADPHLVLVSTVYEKEPYLGATECRTCHRVKLKGWANPWVKRTTRRPHGRLTPLK